MAAGKGLPEGCSLTEADLNLASLSTSNEDLTCTASFPGIHAYVGAACVHVCPRLAGWGGKIQAWSWWQSPPAGARHLRAVSHCAAWEADGQ